MQHAGQREYNIYKGQKKYPWSGSYTRSGKEAREDQLANFKTMVITVGFAGWSDDGADITNAVKNIQQMILVCMIWLGT
jgi:hypothetical protein